MKLTEKQIDAAITAYDKTYCHTDRGYSNKANAIEAAINAAIAENVVEEYEMVGTRYRIVHLPNGFEPQMLYNTGVGKGMAWFPLNEEGYWLEPDAFSWGEVEKHLVFIYEETAREAINKARAMNGD